jgi:hypothetical protein
MKEIGRALDAARTEEKLGLYGLLDLRTSHLRALTECDASVARSVLAEPRKARLTTRSLRRRTRR